MSHIIAGRDSGFISLACSAHCQISSTPYDKIHIIPSPDSDRPHTCLQFNINRDKMNLIGPSLRRAKDWQDEIGIHTPSGSPTPGSITLCGWLLKMKKDPNKLMGAWVKRWMIVEDGFLKWFNGPDCQQAGKGISLHDVETIKSFDVEEEYSFVVVAQGRNVTLRANRKSERSRWIRGLTLQVDLLHGGTRQGPPLQCHHKIQGMGILKPSVNSTNASGDMKLQTLTLSSRNSSNQYKERRRKGGEGQKERMKLKNENASERGSKRCTVELSACHQPCITDKTIVIKVAPAQNAGIGERRATLK